jgi:hypothetical protein
MEAWLIVLIVVGIVAIAVVAIGVVRTRKRRQSSASIGLPPLGAVSADGPITNEAASGTTQSSETAKVSDHRSH